MPTATKVPQLKPYVSEKLADIKSRVAGPLNAERLWERHLSPDDRKRLGNDVRVAYQRLGTAGMWAELRGVTPYRAVLELATELNHLTEKDRDWLLREIGESTDVDEAMSAAIESGDLVVVERPRAAHWKGDEIKIDWNRQSASWSFLWELVHYAKAGRSVDSFVFSDDAHGDFVAKHKSRLVNLPAFPLELADQITPVGRGTQQLMLPRERIHVFELNGLGSLREWLP